MKELTHYVCETCGGMYLTEKLAQDCEASHAKPLSIAVTRYPSSMMVDPMTHNIPIDILVKFEHGKSAWYTLK